MRSSWNPRRLHDTEQFLQTSRIKRGNQVGQIRSGGSDAGAVAVLYRSRYRLWWCISRSGLCAQNQLSSDGRIKIVVLVEADVLDTGATIKDLQGDLCGLLIDSSDARDGENTLKDLTTNNGSLRQTRREKQNIDTDTLERKGVFQPGDKVSIEVVQNNNLNVGNVAWSPSWQGQVVVTVASGESGTRTAEASVATAIRRCP